MGKNGRECVAAGASSWWLFLFWFCQLTGLVGGSMVHFRLPPPLAMLVKPSPTGEARRGAYTLHRLQQETQDLAACETVHTQTGGGGNRQFSSVLESRETLLYLKMPQVQEIASHRLAEGGITGCPANNNTDSHSTPFLRSGPSSLLSEFHREPRARRSACRKEPLKRTDPKTT